MCTRTGALSLRIGVMTGKRYNICLVGAGRMGARWAKIFSTNKAVRLVLVVDPDQRAGKKIAQTRAADYAVSFTKQILDAHAIDAVFVVTPHSYLYPNARRALLAGRHVFVEKPGSKTSRELRSLHELAKKRKQALMVGFNYRYFDGVSRAKKLVDSGRIGKVLSVSIRHGHAGRVGYEKEWRMNKRLAGGGVLMDQGVHALDLVHWFLGGKITHVAGVMSNQYWKSNVEDNALVALKSDSGAIGSVYASVTEWKPVFIMEILGAKGYCIVNGVGRKYGGGEKLTIGTLAKNHTVKERTVACNSDPDKCLREELKQFMALALRSKTNADEALSALKVVEEVYGSR